MWIPGVVFLILFFCSHEVHVLKLICMSFLSASLLLKFFANFTPMEPRNYVKAPQGFMKLWAAS